MQLRNTANNAFLNLFTLAGAPAFPVDGTINSVNIGKGANSVAGNTVLGENALDAAVTGGTNTAIGNLVMTNLVVSFWSTKYWFGFRSFRCSNNWQATILVLVNVAMHYQQ